MIRTRPHVLLVPSWYPTPDAPVAGVYFREQAIMLTEAGWRVGVLFAETRSWRRFGSRILTVGRWSRSVHAEYGIVTARSALLNVLPRSWRASRWVAETLRLAERYRAQEGKPDLIHAHGCLWGGHAARLLAERWQVPMVITEHSTAFRRGIPSSRERRWVRLACQQARATVVVSPALGEDMRSVCGVTSTEVIPNVVDTGFFRPGDTGMPKVDLLTVAGLSKRKGIDLLIRAAGLLRDADQVLSIRIIGDGPERGRLRSLARALGIDAHVGFMGEMAREGVRDAMRAARVFVLPSYCETFAVVLAEAMACGLPVVATRSGGPESYVRQPFGWLVDPGDVRGLSLAIREAIDAAPGVDPAVVREAAVRSFSRPTVLRLLEATYARALRAPGELGADSASAASRVEP